MGGKTKRPVEKTLEEKKKKNATKEVVRSTREKKKKDSKGNDNKAETPNFKVKRGKKIRATNQNPNQPETRGSAGRGGTPDKHVQERSGWEVEDKKWEKNTPVPKRGGFDHDIEKKGEKEY